MSPGQEAKCQPRIVGQDQHLHFLTKQQSGVGGPINTKAGITRPPKKTEGASSERTRTQAIRTACFKVPKGASLKKSLGNFMVMPNCKQHCDQCRQPAATQRRAARLRTGTVLGQECDIQYSSGRQQSSQDSKPQHRAQNVTPSRDGCTGAS